MDYQILFTEIQRPVYQGLNDKAVADALNARNVTAERDVVEAWEVFECITATDYTALAAAERTRIQIMLSCGQVNIKGPNTRAMLAAAFGPATTTRANLIALQGKTISRAEQLGLGQVQAGDVARVRGGRW